MPVTVPATFAQFGIAGPSRGSFTGAAFAIAIRLAAAEM
jgi:hypothetical protein